ncbi:MAG: phenylalanine--tRNA ligase subunit beta [Synergistaceae bacterium]|nr:phenylalanine--tRNA ligase subunit beta [Synergistaceae bacterium]
MKLSLNWIKDYVNIPDSLELSRVVYDLTMSTVEVEGVTELGRKFDKMVVGVVNEILPHPNADKLRICRTDTGDGDLREIVCGGINLREGMKAAVSRPGAMVTWHGTGDPIEIKNAKVRGVESYGMICASSEIGLFDLFPFTEEATIVDLSDFAASAGTPLAEALDLDDVILEIDNRSLTNRPDLWGHYGIAREISALYDLPLNAFTPYSRPPAAGFEITIDDPSRCPRYIGVKIEGLSIKPSPFGIQSRIWRVGMRPINAIVDITNYVMLATGQPTHAFDSDNIKGHITVRRARDAEKLLLLNEKELSLSTGDLVIADDSESVALAGVMGGSKDSILPDTDKAILEIANFEAIGVRRTAARHEVRTEAAIRYEKGIDPERGDIALSLAMQMFADLFPGMSVTGFHDNYPAPLGRSEIDVSLDWLEKRLGKRIGNDEISRMLGRLGFDVDFDGDNLHVVSPTWRSTGDVSLPDDIMEEIARMHGFENFEPTSITTAFDSAINQLEIDMDRRIREYLAFRCGMREIFTYPWMSDEFASAILPGQGMLSLSSPPSPDEHYVRASLLPNLCKAVSDNLRFFSEFALFESAQVFFDGDYDTPYDSRESLPRQRRNVAGAYVGDPGEVNPLFRRAKGAVEDLPCRVHVEPITFEQIEKPVWADGVVWLNIIHAGKRIGNLALLSKKVSLDCGIKNSAVMIFELDIDSLKPYPSRTNKFTHLPEYPITEYDISLLFDLNVKWDEILGVITGKKGPEDLLRDVWFVDEYRGRQIPEGKKSVTVRLVIGSLKKTLTSVEIENCANAIVKRLKKTLGAELRG